VGWVLRRRQSRGLRAVRTVGVVRAVRMQVPACVTELAVEEIPTGNRFRRCGGAR
jgi:hypothetical protein